MDQIIYRVWLSLCPGLGYGAAQELARDFGGAFNVYNADVKELRKYIPGGKTLDYFKKRSLSRAEKIMLLSMQNDITPLTPEMSGYPARLFGTGEEPSVIYAKGNVKLLNNRAAFCVVGARRPSAYGTDVCLGLSRRLAEAGLIIVSGHAEGIDQLSHRGALSARGNSICVLACGMDVDYPRGSVRLREEIIGRGGLVISQFPYGSRGLAAVFYPRNRLMAAISLGACMVEGDGKSGALITTRYAMELGREVWSVPGNITSRMSDGANMLIGEGAHVYRDAGAVIDYFYSRFPGYFPENVDLDAMGDEVAAAVSAAEAGSFDAGNKAVIGNTAVAIGAGAGGVETGAAVSAATKIPLNSAANKKAEGSNSSAPAHPGNTPSPPKPREKKATVLMAAESGGRDELERNIIKALKKGEQSVDELCELLEITAAAMNTKLAIMTVKGVVKEHAGRNYSLK